MAKKKPTEKDIDPKRLITAEFVLAALRSDVAALAQRVQALEERPWWRRFFRCH